MILKAKVRSYALLRWPRRDRINELGLNHLGARNEVANPSSRNFLGLPYFSSWCF
jgi:hypothetical protein